MTSCSGRPRILIVRVGAMGDVLHCMPAVAALRAALPEAGLGWAVEPRWAPLLVSGEGASSTVDRVHLVEAKAWSRRPVSLETMRSIRALRHALRGERYDIAVDLQGTLRSAVIARMSGAKRIVGSAAPREQPARMFYTQRVALHALHVVDQAAELVSAATELQLHAAAAALPTDALAEKWYSNVVGTTAARTVVLAPTAGWGAKQWPAQRFGQLALALHRHGYRVLVNATPHGVDAAADGVVAASAGTATAVACTLPQLIALVRRASLVIAGDTGPLHLAAALGIPVVALFGPTDPARNGPYDTRSHVLRHERSRTDHSRHRQTEAGLQAITPEQVLEAALQMLDDTTATDVRKAY